MSDTTDAGEDCVASWCAGEDWCAVTCAMDVIGNKWHPVIVHRLLHHGPLRFNELADDIDGVTNKTLSQSLEALEEDGLVARDVVSEKPVAVEYSLTEQGESLRPVIDALESWGEAYLDPDEADDGCAC